MGREFRLAMFGALDYVDILVTTFGQCTQPEVIEVFHPYCIIMEELAQVAEANVWPVFGAHWMAHVRLAVGGMEQIPPTSFAPAEKNPMSDSYASSLQTRLAKAGLRTPT